MAPKPTEQQAQAIATIRARKDTFIRALAGTGKTKTVLDAIARLSADGVNNGLLCAFNVKIRDELTHKLRKLLGRDPQDAGWQVRTLNSVGHGILLANGYGKRGQLDLDTRKNNKIIDEALRAPSVRSILKGALTPAGRVFLRSGDEASVFDGLLVETLRSAKLYGVTSASMSSQALEPLLQVAAQQTSFPDGLIGATPDLARVMERCLHLNLALARDHNTIDFTDQIYLSAKHCTHPGRTWNVVVADEIQDFSWQMHAILQRICRQQLVLVGDDFQAIYTRLLGASIEALNDVVAKRGMETVTLDKSFRCAQAICDKQTYSGYLPSFTPFLGSKAPLGDVRMPFFQAPKNGKSLNKGDARWKLKALMADDPEGKGTLVLASYNASIVEFATVLWIENRPLLHPDRLCYLGQRIPLTMWRRAASLHFGQSKADSLLLAACSLFLKVSHQTPEAASELFEGISGSDREEGKLTLATVHSTKGLEADKVIIVNPHQLGESSLIYVAQTRARHTLYSVNTSWYGGSKSLPLPTLAIYSGWVKAPVPVSPRQALKQALAEIPPQYRIGKQQAVELLSSTLCTPQLTQAPSDEQRTAAKQDARKRHAARKKNGQRKKAEKAQKRHDRAGPRSGAGDVRLHSDTLPWAQLGKRRADDKRLRDEHGTQPDRDAARQKPDKNPAASRKKRRQVR